MIGVVLDANIDIVVGHGYYQNCLLTGSIAGDNKYKTTINPPDNMCKRKC